MKKAKIGIIGCGNISQTYGRLLPNYNNLNMLYCADIIPEMAQVFAKRFYITALSIEEILNSDADIIINLTLPAVHKDVSVSILKSGKHVYSEKPLAVHVTEAQEILKTAKAYKKRVGCAPDTFLGGAAQQARQLLDDNAVGHITTGTVHVLSHGMEMWHPNPDFFFQPGGGPVLDLGPYYINLLIHLLGPIKTVGAMGNKGTPTRTITSDTLSGQTIQVNTPTTLHAHLEFKSGAIIALSASWDVWGHGHKNPVELYGTKGSIFLPDPNWFAGKMYQATANFPEPDIVEIPQNNHPLYKLNDVHPHGTFANHRGVGVSDMVNAIQSDRTHRCSGEMALHALEVMEAILKSAETHTFIDMQTTCNRPEAFGTDLANSLLV